MRSAKCLSTVPCTSICNNTQLSLQAEAQTLADKLCESIGHQFWPSGSRLTASFGVTAFHRSEDIGEAIKRADSALYRAKSNGRNCVQFA